MTIYKHKKRKPFQLMSKNTKNIINTQKTHHLIMSKHIKTSLLLHGWHRSFSRPAKRRLAVPEIATDSGVAPIFDAVRGSLSVVSHQGGSFGLDWRIGEAGRGYERGETRSIDPGFVQTPCPSPSHSVLQEGILTHSHSDSSTGLAAIHLYHSAPFASLDPREISSSIVSVVSCSSLFALLSVYLSAFEL